MHEQEWIIVKVAEICCARGHAHDQDYGMHVPRKLSVGEQKPYKAEDGMTLTFDVWLNAPVVFAGKR